MLLLIILVIITHNGFTQRLDPNCNNVGGASFKNEASEKMLTGNGVSKFSDFAGEITIFIIPFIEFQKYKFWCNYTNATIDCFDSSLCKIN